MDDAVAQQALRDPYAWLWAIICTRRNVIQLIARRPSVLLTMIPCTMFGARTHVAIETAVLYLKALCSGFVTTWDEDDEDKQTSKEALRLDAT